LGQVGFVAPGWRRRGIGKAMLAWLEQRQRAIAQQHPEAAACEYHSVATEGEKARAMLLQQAGYHAVRQFHEMVIRDLAAAPDFPLPAGFELRPVLPEHQRAIWDAHMEGLRHSLWGWVTPTDADYQNWRKSPLFQPQLWQVAWHVETNQVAGQVKPFIDAVQNEAAGRRRGWTEYISVGELWRRRGLARALVSRALRAQREAGMTESALGVDTANAHSASRVYADCGFRVEKTSTVWCKPFSPGQPS
jgi:GNAT superfamily N-acetyltransferase